MTSARLSLEVIRFILEALSDGRLTRASACCLITPWVEGDLQADALVEDIAQTIHGLDVVRGQDGLDRHESQGGRGTHVVDDDAVEQLLRTLLARLEESA